MGMPDVEKVIKGLEWCIRDDGDCSHPERCECPYLPGPHHGDCMEEMMRDALALLNAQVPRLVVKADFENADAYGYLPVWCEMPDDLYCECIKVDALDEEGCRYWTARPTDKQREAVKWDERYKI